jgi:two-component system, LytTR family, response regulator
MPGYRPAPGSGSVFRQKNGHREPEQLQKPTPLQILNHLFMINYIIIDDEPRNIKVLKNMLDEFCPDTCFTGAAVNSKKGEELIRKTRPDLVFLDIQMPNGNAFDLLDRLLPVSFEIIFVTAFNDYTLKAFRYCALDYLLKPVNIDELCDAVQKAAEKLRLKNVNRQLNNLLANLRLPEATSHKLALPNLENLVFISVSDIIHCEASGGYTIFHMKGGEKILSTKTIKEYEDLLPASTFLRVHHSHIVNLFYIHKYHKGRGGYIEMEGRVMIEVSVRRKNDFLTRFGF